jgi:hypothetical protein
MFPPQLTIIRRPDVAEKFNGKVEKVAEKIKCV